MGAVVVERERGAGVVVLSGEQDAYAASRVGSELGVLLAEGVPVVVDLSVAIFVDSATLLELLRARKVAAAMGLGFVVQMDADTGRYVRKVFEITRLASVFAIETTRESAVARALDGVAASALGAEPA